MSHQKFSFEEILISSKMNALADDVSDSTDGHDHSGLDGGKGLDWDTCWSDCIHNHSSNAEGGKLNWGTCWLDLKHYHLSNAEGGKLDWDNCWATDPIHDHSGDLISGAKFDFDYVWASDPIHNHQSGGQGGIIDTPGIKSNTATSTVVGNNKVSTAKIANNSMGYSKFQKDYTTVTHNTSSWLNKEIGTPSDIYFYPTIMVSPGGRGFARIAEGYSGDIRNNVALRRYDADVYLRFLKIIV